jgi:hypothetical protein
LKKREQINILLTEKEQKLLIQLASIRVISKSGCVRQLIVEEIKRLGV